jgi:hypothetical protein
LRQDGSLKFLSALDQKFVTYMEIQASSGSSTRKLLETDISINPINDAPILSGIASTKQTYNQGSGAVLLTPLSPAVFTDPDSRLSPGSSIEVEITSNLVASEDKLALAVGGDDAITLGTGAVAAIQVSGRFSGNLAQPFAEGRKLRIDIPNTVRNADVQAMLRAITYENTNTVNPSASTRQLTITLSDGEVSSVYRVEVEVIPTRTDPESLPTSPVTPTVPDPIPVPVFELEPASDTAPVVAPDPTPAPLSLEGLDVRYPLRLVINSGTQPYSASLADPELGHLRVEGNTIFLRGIREGSTIIKVLDAVGDEISATLEFRPWERAHTATGFSNFYGATNTARFKGGTSKDGGAIYRHLEEFSVGETFHLFFSIDPRPQDLMQQVTYLVAIINGNRPEEVLLLNPEGQTVLFDEKNTVGFKSGVLTQGSIIDVTTNQPIELTPDLRGDWYIFVGYELPNGEIIYPQEATQLRVR